MTKWRVYNVHPKGLTHKENFKGDLIEIRAGAYVLMDYDDAVQFKSQYFPIFMDAQDQQDVKSYKCLKLEADDKEIEAEPIKLMYVCHFDGKTFETKEMLEAYVNTEHADKMHRDPEIEEELKKKKGK